MSVTVEPLDAPLGAVLKGVDTRYALRDADFQIIEQALLDHLAIVIADLEDDLDWLLDVGRRFGPLTPHILTRFHHPKTPEMSIITANMDNAESRETARPAGAFWHSDLSYCRDPSDAIFLYATHAQAAHDRRLHRTRNARRRQSAELTAPRAAPMGSDLRASMDRRKRIPVGARG